MAIFTPTYGGQPIFGLAVKIEEIPAQCAQQVESFFGVDGLLSVFGGSHNRSFSISGVLFDEDLQTLNADEDLFTPGVNGSLADGIARPLFDTRGRTWANVVYLGQFQPDPMGPRPAVWGSGGGWALPYRAVFHGLS
jgi:hypothetical protein